MNHYCKRYPQNLRRSAQIYGGRLVATLLVSCLAGEPVMGSIGPVGADLASARNFGLVQNRPLHLPFASQALAPRNTQMHVPNPVVREAEVKVARQAGVAPEMPVATPHADIELRSGRLEEVRRLVEPMLNKPATDQELNALLDIPLRKMSADKVLRILPPDRFDKKKGQPNHVSLGMKGLWALWNAPAPAPTAAIPSGPDTHADGQDDAVGSILIHHVEGEFKQDEIMDAFMQYLEGDPQRAKDLIRHALGRFVQAPVFDFNELPGTMGGLLYYVIQLGVGTIGRRCLGSVALGAARTPETRTVTADDFNNRATLYSIDSRYVPKPLGHDTAAPPGGRRPDIFVTEWLEGFDGVRARIIDGRPGLELRTRNGGLPLTPEQKRRLWRGVGKLFGVYAINPKHLSIGSLRFDRSDVALSAAPEAPVDVKLTACPILEKQTSRDAAIRKNFMTAFLADFKVDYGTSEGEEKTGRALLADPFPLISGFYEGLLDKWTEGTPSDPVERRLFVQGKMQELLAQAAAELEASLDARDEHSRNEMTVASLPFLRLYSDRKYWTMQGPLDLSQVRGDSPDLAAEPDLEGILALRERRCAQGVSDGLSGVPPEVLIHFIRDRCMIHRPNGRLSGIEVPYVTVLRDEGRVVGYALSRWVPAAHAGAVGLPVLEPGLENAERTRQLMEMQVRHLRNLPGVAQIVFGDPSIDGALGRIARDLGFHELPVRSSDVHSNLYVLNCEHSLPAAVVPLPVPERELRRAA